MNPNVVFQTGVMSAVLMICTSLLCFVYLMTQTQKGQIVAEAFIAADKSYAQINGEQMALSDAMRSRVKAFDRLHIVRYVNG
jgi:hypothetical protein